MAPNKVLIIPPKDRTAKNYGARQQLQQRPSWLRRTEQHWSSAARRVMTWDTSRCALARWRPHTHTHTAADESSSRFHCCWWRNASAPFSPLSVTEPRIKHVNQIAWLAAKDQQTICQIIAPPVLVVVVMLVIYLHCVRSMHAYK